MGRLIPVEGQPGIFRDEDSGHVGSLTTPLSADLGASARAPVWFEGFQPSPDGWMTKVSASNAPDAAQG